MNIEGTINRLKAQEGWNDTTTLKLLTQFMEQQEGAGKMEVKDLSDFLYGRTMEANCEHEPVYSTIEPDYAECMYCGKTGTVRVPDDEIDWE